MAASIEASKAWRSRARIGGGRRDCVTTPFQTWVPAGRTRFVGTNPAFKTAEQSFDLAAGEDREVRLTPNEYQLLATLVRHAGKVLTHRQLLKAVWGPTYLTEVHYVRLYMGQLRHKLEADPARPRYLRTEPGVGYRLLAE